MICRMTLQTVAAEDCFVSSDSACPRAFPRNRKNILRHPSMTSRCFTGKEGGEQHCQIGNHSIAVDTILDWIEILTKMGT